MTLNQLKYVIALSKENSINEAAKKLFVSQPSLTASLKSLEQEIGFDIFLRNKSGISLTVKGTELQNQLLSNMIFWMQNIYRKVI